MPQIETHVTMCLVAQAKACMQYVIGADLGAAELDMMTGSLSITNHQKQVRCTPRVLPVCFNIITCWRSSMVSCMMCSLRICSTSAWMQTA